MIREDDERRARPPARHQVGEALDTLSVEDLAERIELLKTEIARLEAAITAKQASRSAADAVFKR